MRRSPSTGGLPQHRDRDHQHPSVSNFARPPIGTREPNAAPPNTRSIDCGPDLLVRPSRFPPSSSHRNTSGRKGRGSHGRSRSILHVSSSSLKAQCEINRRERTRDGSASRRLVVCRGRNNLPLRRRTHGRRQQQQCAWRQTTETVLLLRTPAAGGSPGGAAAVALVAVAPRRRLWTRRGGGSVRATAVAAVSRCRTSCSPQSARDRFLFLHRGGGAAAAFVSNKSTASAAAATREQWRRHRL